MSRLLVAADHLFVEGCDGGLPIALVVVARHERGTAGEAFEDGGGDVETCLLASRHPAPSALRSLILQEVVHIVAHLLDLALALLVAERQEGRGEVVDIDAVGQIEVARHTMALELRQRLHGIVHRAGVERHGDRVEGREAEAVAGLLRTRRVGGTGNVEQVACGDALAVREHRQPPLLTVGVMVSG